MARTVSNKRGSVRGAPPDVYLPFSGSDEDSHWEESTRVFKRFIVIGVWIVVAWTIASLFCIGWAHNEYQ